MWRSLVARAVWDREVEGSNPFTPTSINSRKFNVTSALLGSCDHIKGKTISGLMAVEAQLDTRNTGFVSAEEAIERIANRHMLLVSDRADRENEADLVMAAEFATPEDVAFMRLFGGGLICMPAASEIFKRLEIGLMMPTPEEELIDSTNFTTTFSHGSYLTRPTSCFAASQRAETMLRALDPDSTPEEFERPGGVLGLWALDGDVLVRPGHTEAAVALARLAGLRPAGIIVEVLDNTATPIKGEALDDLAKTLGIARFSIDTLVEYRLSQAA